MKYLLPCVLLFASISINGQTALTIEGKTYFNADTNWLGVNIPRSVPTSLIFRNNSITSVNTFGYMLQAGDDEISSTNNNLEGEIITGNKFLWNGTDMTSITHGLFTGHNLNAIIKYNYLDHVPMGIIRKSGTNMSDTGGGVAYNIVKSGAVGINIKGMSNVRIYNNTLYTDRKTSETWRGLVYVYTHIDVTPNSVSHGTKIYNNIFYTKYQTYSIQIADIESTVGLESDYNIFYCETGSPVFSYCGQSKTFAEWQALGYDTHSKVINPGFRDFVSFVPATRLDYGKNLGVEWVEGLSVNATWGPADPQKEMQNGNWQVGAFVHKATESIPANQVPSVIISSPTKSTAFIAPATITIDANATDSDGTITLVEFYNGTTRIGERTSPPWSFTWKEVSEGTYSITAAATDNSNARTVSSPVNVVVEKSSTVVNQIPSVIIASPANNMKFEIPASVSIVVDADDPDGTVSRVEYYIGPVKIGESFDYPYSFTFQCDSAGTYEITAKAYDNLNAGSVSDPVRFIVNPRSSNPDLINLYPNPNYGNFTLVLPPRGEDNPLFTISIISIAGRTVFSYLSGGDEDRMPVDISHSPKGNYIVTVSSGGKIVSSKQFAKL